MMTPTQGGRHERISPPVTAPHGPSESTGPGGAVPPHIVGAAIERQRQRILEAEERLALLREEGIRARRLERDLAAWRRTYALLCEMAAEAQGAT